tara:strand:+ start:135 stop:557 length:423 start_codon:yes stop_codon:yes gene_type:complete
MRNVLLIVIPLFAFFSESIKAESLSNNNKSSEQTSNITIISDIQTNDNKKGVFNAIGNVKITYPNKNILATSDKAKYLKLENKIILTGNVHMIKKNSHSILAEEIVFIIGDDRIIANSKSKSQVLTKLLFTDLKNDKGLY